MANSEGQGIVGVATDFVCLLHASHFFWSDLGIFLDNVSVPRWCGSARRGWREKEEKEKEQEREKESKEMSKVREKQEKEKVKGQSY